MGVYYIPGALYVIFPMLSYLSYSWGSWGSESLNNLLKLTQVIDRGIGICMQAAWIQS